MKRWNYDELAEFEPDGNSEWISADEVDEVIMNMVDEFAETAKGYEAELVKKDEEIARLRKALEWYRCNSLNGGEKAIEALERKSP